MEDCNGACIDTQSDPKHCGACGNACGSGLVCQGDGQTASCVGSCDSNFTDCDGACVSLQDHVSHCGSCGNSCGDANICTADSCNGGECSNPSGGGSCNDGNSCTEDSCDPKDGCIYTAYTQTEIESLCQQLEDMDPTKGCVFCDTYGALCNNSAVPDVTNPGTCSIIDPNSPHKTTCYLCTTQAPYGCDLGETADCTDQP